MKKHLPFLDIYYLSLQRTLFILPSHSAGPSLLSFSFTVSSHLGHAMLCHVCACAQAHALAVGMRCAISFVCCLPSKRCYMFHVCIPNPHPQTIRIFHFVFGSGFFFLRLFCSFRFQCRNKNMRVWFWAKFLRFPSTLADFVWMIFASQFTIIFFFVLS